MQRIRKKIERSETDYGELTRNILRNKHMWFLHILVWIVEVHSKFLNKYKCFDTLLDLLIENQHRAVKTKNVKFTHKKVVGSYNHRKTINLYCYILTARHDKPVGSFIDHKGKTYYQYHMFSMWENSRLVTFFPYGEGYEYEDKEWTKLPKTSKICALPVRQ